MIRKECLPIEWIIDVTWRHVKRVPGSEQWNQDLSLPLCHYHIQGHVSVVCKVSIELGVKSPLDVAKWPP